MRAASDRPEAFGERVVAALDGGALALMLSIGHRTGLFDVLADLPPATSEAIASRAGLCEGPVRAWLLAMAGGRVVDHDARAGTYHLPLGHAASLIRAARPGNLAETCRWIALFGTLEDEVVECFAHGGGLSPAAADGLDGVLAEASDRMVVALLGRLAPPVERGRVDRQAGGIDVLDVDCGGGRALCRMAEAFPESRFLGYERSASAVSAGRRRARALGLSNARIEVRDVAALATDARFDLVTVFGGLPEADRSERILARIARALRPGGMLLVQEHASPRPSQGGDGGGAGLAASAGALLSCLHGLAASLVRDGADLGAAPDAETSARWIRRAGLEPVEPHAMLHDPLHRYTLARRPLDPCRLHPSA
jgi:SAM-dependent methyltransferase